MCAVPIDVVADTEHFIVVNKPIDVPMHDEHLGICKLACEQLNLPNLFLVHRLDTPTSGCLLLAKSSQVASELGKAFENRLVDKYYIAISCNKPSKKQGKIQGILKKTRSGSYSLRRDEQPNTTNAQRAITFFFSQTIEQVGRLFYLKPISGKTHQLRVSLKSLGSPILGDQRYNGDKADRMYLHAYMLTFSLFGKQYKYNCLPQQGEQFNQLLLETLVDPSSLAWPSYKSPNKENR